MHHYFVLGELQLSEPAMFVPLHIRTKYSLIDSVTELEPLLDKAVDMGLPSAAITDRATLAGAVEFYKLAVRKGVKPIIGYECPVSAFADKQAAKMKGSRVFYLVLLAQNFDGYSNLCRLNRKVHSRKKNGDGAVSVETLAQHKEGIIALSGGANGEIDALIRQDRVSAAESLARRISKIFGPDHFYLELQQNPACEKADTEWGITSLARRLDIDLAATVDCSYLYAEEAEILDIFRGIYKTGDHQTGQEKGYHLPGLDEMKARFADMPEALENTVFIANRCNVEFRPFIKRYPHFSEQPEQSQQRLEKAAKLGLKQYVQRQDEKWSISKWKQYLKRLKRELRAIEGLQQAGYFRMTADVVDYARTNQIPVGPGRGSVCASLVAYCLGITEIDPLAWGLISELFASRVASRYPEIQLDVSADRRSELLDYFYRTYATDDNAAAVTVFAYDRPRQLVKKVGQYLAIDDEIMESLLQSVSKYPCAVDELFGELEWDEFPASKKSALMELVRICYRLYPLPKRTHRHKTGFVVADFPLIDRVPIIDEPDTIRSELTADSVKQLGLARIYFLPLPELDKTQETIHRIQRNYPDFRIETIPEEDAETFRLIRNRDTDGIFQLKSWAMSRLAEKIGVDKLSDLVALIALFRPGPLERGLADELIQNKHPKIVRYEAYPVIRRILAETYGVLLYQEQVVEICEHLLKLSSSRAVRMPRTVALQDPEELARERKDLWVWSKSTKHPDWSTLRALFERFVAAGPCLSSMAHSVAYAKMIYQMAYLKTHFPHEFEASFLGREKNLVENLQ